MIIALEDSDTCDTDETEWLDESFYEQDHMISNLEYAKLKFPTFTVKLHKRKLIIAVCDTGTTCSCISHHLFMKISEKVNITH